MSIEQKHSLIEKKILIHFFFHSQGTAQVATPPPAANITPSIGSYNPTLDSDRRRNFRTKGEDESGASNSGPKNRYGTYIFFLLFSKFSS